MKQQSLGTTGFELATKRMRKREFLDEMNLMVPWLELFRLIQPHAQACKTGRLPFAVEPMLRIHFMQQWFGLSDPTMEEALHDVPLYCQIVRLDSGLRRLPDESTIFRFRHLLEAGDLSLQIMAAIKSTLAQKGLMLKTGAVIDKTLIAAPSSTKNKEGERDPEMHQTKKGNQWHFDMKAHIDVDADSGLVHSVIGIDANVNDVIQSHCCCMDKKPWCLPIWATKGPTSELHHWRQMASSCSPRQASGTKEHGLGSAGGAAGKAQSQRQGQGRPSVSGMSAHVARAKPRNPATVAQTTRNRRQILRLFHNVKTHMSTSALASVVQTTPSHIIHITKINHENCSIHLHYK